MPVLQALLGRVEVSRALLTAGADANTTDHNSFSPLYLASQNGHTQLVLDLLAAGADAGIKTSKVIFFHPLASNMGLGAFDPYGCDVLRKRDVLT